MAVAGGNELNHLEQPFGQEQEPPAGHLLVRTHSLAPRLASGILTTVFCAIGAASFLSVLLAKPTVAELLVCTVCLASLLTLQLGYLSRTVATRRRAVTYIALAGEAGLVYLPILSFGGAWIGLPGVLAGSLLLTVPAPLAITLCGLVVASLVPIGAAHGLDTLAIVHLILSVGITALVVYGLSRLALLVRQLEEAREELARCAVIQERLRFSRDVHDLLGLSLSAIALKSELVSRLMTDRPDQAREEIGEIMQMSRQALADVRSVASGTSRLSLIKECRLARSVLEAAQVELTLNLTSDIPEPASTAFATLLREGVTNVLRHTKAEWCEITIGMDDSVASMEILNNGVACSPLVPAPDGGGGSGLRNLSERMAVLGGSLTARPEDDGCFRLTAVLPVVGTSVAGEKRP
jgi:two-component system sensor histidine kinase DesK